MRAGSPTGCGIRLRVYGVRLATVPADEGYQLVTDEDGRLVPTGERYRIPRALAPRIDPAEPVREAEPDCPPSPDARPSADRAGSDHA